MSKGGFLHWLKTLRKLQILEFDKHELLPVGTHEYRLDNEVTFYHQYAKPIRLYVKWDQIETDVPLPNGDMENMLIDINKNTLFLFVNNEIYSVDFDPPRRIKISLLRYISSYEEVHYREFTPRIFCISTKQSNSYLCNLWDNPDVNGVKSDDEAKNGKDLHFLGFHRGKILLYGKDTVFPKIVKLDKNTYAVKFSADGHFSSFFQESSPYLYVLLYENDNQEFLTFNTDTIEMLPMMVPKLKFRSGHIKYHITSVIDNVLQVDQERYTGYVLDCRTTFRAKLPKGYFLNIPMIGFDYILNSFNSFREPDSLLHVQQFLKNSLPSNVNVLNEPDSQSHVHGVPLTLDSEDFVDDALDFTMKEKLSNETISIYQTDEGTLFHLDMTIPKLFVKQKSGKQIDKMLHGKISCMYVHGNALYYLSEVRHIQEIHKAEYTRAGTIDSTYCRDVEKNESVFGLGLCRSYRDGAQYVYRICDDPIRDGVKVDDFTNGLDLREWSSLTFTTFIGLHRGVAIFITSFGHGVRKMSEKSILIEISRDIDFSGGFQLISQDSFSIIYIVNDKYLIALHTETLELLPVLRLDSNVISFAGEHNGILTACRIEAGEKYLMTARLPALYRHPPQLPPRLSSTSHSPVTRFAGRTSDNATADLKEERHPPQLPPRLSSTSHSPVTRLGQTNLWNVAVNNNVDYQPADNNYESEFLKRFQPRRLIGFGGYGQVFEAEHNIVDGIKGNFAIKRIPIRESRLRQRDEDSCEAALKEVSALVSFEHPGIVRFFDAWREEPPEGWQRWCDNNLLKQLKSNLPIEPFSYRDDCSFIYIQMEYCAYSLFDWLSSNTQREQPRVKNWFKQIVSAVEYIHDQKKIHRDLKPSNILFAGEDRLKICDLGIVAEQVITNGRELAQTRTMGKGTGMYMAPEQTGFRYTSKVDIFALGLIFAEMSVVISTDDAAEAFQMYRRRQKPDILRHLPRAEMFVDWLTSNNPDDRPACSDILRCTPHCPPRLFSPVTRETNDVLPVASSNPTWL